MNAELNVGVAQGPVVLAPDAELPDFLKRHTERKPGDTFTSDGEVEVFIQSKDEVGIEDVSSDS